VHIKIWIGASQPIAGHVELEGRAPLPFEGWLQLLQQLSELVSLSEMQISERDVGLPPEHPGEAAT
jgi:hypothetical protein